MVRAINLSGAHFDLKIDTTRVITSHTLVNPASFLGVHIRNVRFSDNIASFAMFCELI